MITINNIATKVNGSVKTITHDATESIRGALPSNAPLAVSVAGLPPNEAYTDFSVCSPVCDIGDSVRLQYLYLICANKLSTSMCLFCYPLCVSFFISFKTYPPYRMSIYP